MMMTSMTTSVSDFLAESTFLAFLDLEAVVAAVTVAVAVAAAILGPILGLGPIHIRIILRDTSNNRLTQTFLPRKGNKMWHLRRPKRPNQQRGEWRGRLKRLGETKVNKKWIIQNKYQSHGQRNPCAHFLSLKEKNCIKIWSSTAIKPKHISHFLFDL